MLYNWATIYHSHLTSGQDYTQLKPTTSIWLLEDKLFSPEKDAVDQFDNYLHLNFQPYDVNANIYLSNHLEIHVLQLPFFKKEQLIQDDKDRWLYFFKEGQNLEIDKLPKYLKTKEIMKAMETLNHFSNDQKAYLLYQDRLEATRVASTWQSLLKQKDSEIQMKNSEILMKDSEIQTKDSEIQTKDSEIQMKDSEIKKLRSLIHQMGGQA